MKRIAVNSLLLIAALVFICILAELFFRLFLPQNLILIHSDIWVPDSLFGWKPKPDARMVVNWGEGRVHFRTDKHGFRLNSGETPPQRSGNKILFLGDSFVQALQMENEQTFSQVLPRKLQESTGKNYLGINAGCSGWNPGQYWLQAREVLASDIFVVGVVCLWAGDDITRGIDTLFTPFQARQLHRFSFPKNFTRKELIQSLLYPANDFLEMRSHLFVFLKRRFSGLLGKWGLTAKSFPKIFLTTEDNAPRWRDTTLTLKLMQNEFEKHHIPALFLLLPTEFQVHRENFKAYVDWFNLNLDSVDLELPGKMLTYKCRLDNIELVDLLPYFREKAKRGMRLFGKVDLHLNAEGHLTVAEAILPFALKTLQN